MITINNRTTGGQFKYTDDAFYMNGNFTKEPEGAFTHLEININTTDGAHKGNAFLQGEELLYNFTNVKPSETAEIAEHCETCFAELKENI